jgi:hypothetical protein
MRRPIVHDEKQMRRGLTAAADAALNEPILGQRRAASRAASGSGRFAPSRLRIRIAGAGAYPGNAGYFVAITWTMWS